VDVLPAPGSMAPPDLVKRLLNSVCGVELEDDEDTTAGLRRKLMVEGAQEQGLDGAGDEPFPRPPWLSSMFAELSAELDGGASGKRQASTSGNYSAPVVPPAADEEPGERDPLAAPEGAPEPAANPLGDLSSLMKRVEELEAAGDLDAAARLLSGAVGRR